MENIKDSKLIIFSSRLGGPHKQHHLLYEYLLKDGYNVVHWFGFWKWVLLHFVYKNNIRILTNVPFIFRFKKNGYYLSIHGNYNIEKSFKNILGYFYEVNTRWAKKIIVPNLFLKKVIKKEKAIIIFNFVEEITLPKFIKKQEEITLATVTNFNFKDKAIGIINIIKSLSLLKINKTIVLNVYGDGRFLNEIKFKSQNISLPINIKINFCGYSKNIINELTKSNIFVYWSNLDVSPLCLTEAMACGLPIIINNYAPFSECIPKDNIFCSDENDFSDGIKSLVSDAKTRNIIGLENKLFYEKISKNNKKILNEWKNILELDVTTIK